MKRWRTGNPVGDTLAAREGDRSLFSEMARYRRRQKDPFSLLDLVPPVAGLLLIGVLFMPGFKQVLGAFFSIVIALAALAIVAGIGFLIWRLARRSVSGAAIVDGPSPLGIREHIIALAPIQPCWSLELLQSLEWKRYEDVVAEYAKHLGFEGKTTRIGADGGIDVHIYEPGNPRPVMVVQCKAWDSYRVGVKPLRELYGVMAAEQIKEGAFFTTSDFTTEAQEFAKGKSLDLVNGAELLTRIKQLPDSAQSDLLRFATAGDYTTPTCPNCGIKMVNRTAKKGANAGNNFWGCRNYPRCSRTFTVSRN